MGQQVAYAAAAQLAIVNDPTKLTLAQVVVQFAQDPSTDPKVLAQGIQAAHQAALDNFNADSQDAYAAQTAALKGATGSLATTAAGANKVVAASQAVMGDLLLNNARVAQFRVGLGDRIDAVLANVDAICRNSQQALAVCDASLAPLFGVSLSDSAAKICSGTGTNFDGCDILTSNGAITSAQLLQRFTTSATALNTATANCMSADTGAGGSSSGGSTPKVSDACPDSTKANAGAADIGALGNVVGKVGFFLGLFDGPTRDRLISASKATGELYTGVSATIRGLSNLDLDAASKAFTSLGTLESLIFGEKDASTQALVDTVSSIFGGIQTIGAGINLLDSVFGLGGSGGANAQLLAQIAALKSLIEQFEKTVQTRFDLLDFRLDLLNVAFDNDMNLLSNKLNGVAVSDEQIQEALGDLSRQLTDLSSMVNEQLHDLQLNALDNIVGIDVDVSQDEFNKEEDVLYNMLKNDVFNSVAAGPTTYSSDPTQIYSFLSSGSLGYLLNLLNQYPALEFKGAPYTGQRVASLLDLVSVGNTYVALVDKYPSFTQGNALIGSHLAMVRTIDVASIRALQQAVQRDPQTFTRLIDTYEASITTLQGVINARLPDFLVANEQPGQDFTSLNIYGAADQASQHTPSFVATGKLTHCGGNYSPINLIDNWQELANSPLAINAEALGLSQLSACYDGAGSGEGGWTNYSETKVKPDRYVAYGDLSFKLVLSSLDNAGNSVLVNAIRVDVPNATFGYPKAVCIMYSTNTVKDSGTKHPVAYVLSEAWQGAYTDEGGGYCDTDGYRVKAVETTNWNHPEQYPHLAAGSWSGTAAETGMISAVNDRLLALRQRFASEIAGEMKSTTPVGLAAQAVETNRLALMRFVELAYPGQSQNNPALSSLFNGDIGFRLPTTADYVTQLTSLAGDKQSPRIDVAQAGKVTANAEMLRSIAANTGAAVSSGNLVESFEELDALDSRLALLQAAVGH